jgi:hypothetical protein
MTRGYICEKCRVAWWWFGLSSVKACACDAPGIMVRSRKLKQGLRLASEDEEPLDCVTCGGTHQVAGGTCPNCEYATRVIA